VGARARAPPPRRGPLASARVAAASVSLAVPPTNNGSELALRHSVVHRKATGGFRSDWGADAHAIVTTVLDTTRKRGEDLLTTLHAALGQPAVLPPGLPILSPSR
jgi:hypothetical protein